MSYLAQLEGVDGIFDFLKKKDDEGDKAAAAPASDRFKWPGGKAGEKDPVYGIFYGTSAEQAQPIIDAYHARQVAAAAGFSSVNDYNSAMEKASQYGSFAPVVGRAGAAGWTETLAVLGGLAIVGFVVLKRRK